MEIPIIEPRREERHENEKKVFQCRFEVVSMPRTMRGLGRSLRDGGKANG